MASCFAETAQADRGAPARGALPGPAHQPRNPGHFEEAVYAAGASDLTLTVLFGHAREALAACDVALVASGTATLETAPRPQAYGHHLQDGVAHRPAHGEDGDRSVRGVAEHHRRGIRRPEILQDDATPENLAQAVLNSLNDPVVGRKLPERLNRMRLLLRRDTAARASEALLPWLRPV